MRILIVFGWVVLASCQASVDEPATASDLVLDRNGVPSELYESHTHTVRRNETIGGILTGLGVDPTLIQPLIRQSEGAINPARLVPGHTFTLYTPLADTTLPRVLVYEPDIRRFVVASFDDPLFVESRQRDVTLRKRAAEGVIDGSLYETLMALDTSPALAVAMADVFAWQVDFYRIQRGDAFKVIYEEEVLDGQSIGVGRIQSAIFHHAGKEFVALYAEYDGKGDYYDMDGNSLRRAFLKAPLKFSRISSRFTNRRFHPVLKRNMPHHGTDYAAPTGTPIMAVGDAVVTHAGYTGGNGNYVRLRHNSTYETGYLHMSRIAKGIRPGVRVTQGQVIGYVGSTGLATGPHLCYRFWKNGQPVDPHRIEFPSSNPIAEAHRADFDRVKMERYAELTRPSMLRQTAATPPVAPETSRIHVPTEPFFRSF
jgi:murein DD-endopeptidase MepM/ murein hydrolase activator NlpD